MKAALAVGAYETAYVLCNGIMQAVLSASGIQNVYNIKVFEYHHFVHDVCVVAPHRPKQAGCPEPPLCYEFDAATSFLNSQAVQTALGVPSGFQCTSLLCCCCCVFLLLLLLLL